MPIGRSQTCQTLRWPSMISGSTSRKSLSFVRRWSLTPVCTPCPNSYIQRSRHMCALEVAPLVRGAGGPGAAPLVRGAGGPGVLVSHQTRTVMRVTSLVTCPPCPRKEKMEMTRITRVGFMYPVMRKPWMLYPHWSQIPAKAFRVECFEELSLQT